MAFLCETWLSSEISKAEITMGSSFKIVARSDRNYNEHGGVLILATEDIIARYNIEDISNDSYPFSLSCSLHLENILILFILIYCPPASSSYKPCFDDISNSILYYVSSIKEKYTGTKSIETILLGDFNLPGINWETLSGSNLYENRFLDLLYDIDLFQLIKEPTHIEGNTLDLIATSCPDITYSLLRKSLSHHYPIAIHLPENTIDHDAVSLQQYSKSSFDITAFNFALNDLYMLLYENRIGYDGFMQNWFHGIAKALALSLTPKRTKRINYPNFYSSHTLHLINKRDTLMRKITKNLNWVLIFKLCLIKNEISESIELDKATFLDTINLTDIRHCFKYLRSMKTSSVYPSVLEWNGYKAHSIVEKANVFNNYFCSVFGPATQITIVLSNHPSIILSNSLVAVSEVENMLKECDDNLSAGSDNVPAFVLHHSASILAPLVHSLFQCIVDTGIWPDEWKTAFIIPLHKNGSISLAQNYRPISILVKLSLVFERMLFRYIFPLVRAQISSSQHGFIKGRSTLSQLLLYLDSLYRSSDESVSVCAVYFDFKKAFDLVPHDKLLIKLSTFGFDEKFLLLFKSYLSNRRQCVKLEQTVSELKNVTSGVPQGSVLGPLLFTLFINDISDNLQYTESLLYADDLKTWAQIFSSACAIQLNSDINSLTLWADDNGMIFNLEKIKFMCFGPGNLSLSMKDVPICEVNEIKDLGLLIDNRLCWDSHIKYQLHKCSQILALIKRSVPFGLSCWRKLQLYQSLILSILLYCSEVWCPSVTSLKKLEAFQKKFFRWLNPSASYQECLKTWNFLPLCYILIEKDMLLLWRILNGKVDADFSSKISFSASSIATRSNDQPLLEIKICSKFKTHDNFFLRSVRTGNYLLRNRVIDFGWPYQKFKSSLHSYLCSLRDTKFMLHLSCTFYVKCFCTNCRS